MRETMLKKKDENFEAAVVRLGIAACPFCETKDCVSLYPNFPTPAIACRKCDVVMHAKVVISRGGLRDKKGNLKNFKVENLKSLIKRWNACRSN